MPGLAGLRIHLGLPLILCAAAAGQDVDLTSLPLEDLMQIEVQTASLHAQSASTAPGAVTVITAAQIRKFGYRTLGEALNSVPGYYLTYDHTYYSVGIAGFSVPGDWATRTLVLIDGHSLTDNIFGSANYFGEDFPLDMSLVGRIEILRGPSSALYGSNGLLSTVNVITKDPERERGTYVRLETGTLGERKLTVTQAAHLPGHRPLLVSATAFNIAGQQDIPIPGYDASGIHPGHALNMDGSRGYRFSADFKSGNWRILSLASSREKIQAVSFADTVPNDRGTRATDQSAFVDVMYARETTSGHALHWRTYYDQYRYRGVYHYPLGDGSQIDVNREFDAGDWLGTQFTDRFDRFRGHLTFGAELKFDLRALQSTADIQPVYQQNLYVNHPDRFAAGFVQQEWSVGRHWSVDLGVRYDWSAYRSQSLSPRAALVYQPDSRTSIKLLYGRGFRNPNGNELFFEDGKQYSGNLHLQPERAGTWEAVAERALGGAWKASVTLYRMADKNLIVPGYNSQGLIQFRNADQFHGQGVALELSGSLLARLEVAASFQAQKSYSTDRATPANSPGNVAKLRANAELGGRVSVSAGLLYWSERRTLAGAILPAVYLGEATVSKRLGAALDFQAGVRNLANRSYSDPIGLSSSFDTLRQPGRTYFVALCARWNQ